MKGTTYVHAQQKWKASIQVNKKNLAIGHYTLVTDAHEARQLAEQIIKDNARNRLLKQLVIDGVNKWRIEKGFKELRTKKI